MGFRIREEMIGHHEFRNDFGPPGRHPFVMRVEWGPEKVRNWLNPRNDAFLWQELSGEVFAGGLCDHVPCAGTLHLQYFRKRQIMYSFDFAVDDVIYRYVGHKKNIHLHNLLVSHTTCFGTIVELATGKLVSTSLCTFRLHHLPSMLGSIRRR